ncbi:MAG: ribonuclease Z [Chitinophagales bacterium]|nr:ribonuclease Z [Chitinophagales bacterium]
MPFDVTILGSNSALPAHGRHPTSQILNIAEELFLIDCGEATQIQFSRYKVRISRINNIFISHLHGDHYFGLIGIITSYSLSGRKNALHVHGPAGLQDIIHTQLKYSGTSLGYELVFHAFEPENGKVIFSNEHMTVQSLEMKHRIPCSGFLFRETKAEKNIRKDKIAQYGLSIAQIVAAKQGEDITLADGRIVPSSELLFPPHKPRSYAFCTDTLYNESLSEYIKEVDLLYHEATFDHSRLDRAIETFHSTSLQAAAIAKMANVKRMVIGHFSSRYREVELEELLQETRSVFPHTDLALEGRTFGIERSF